MKISENTWKYLKIAGNHFFCFVFISKLLPRNSWRNRYLKTMVPVKESSSKGDTILFRNSPLLELSFTGTILFRNSPLLELSFTGIMVFRHSPLLELSFTGTIVFRNPPLLEFSFTGTILFRNSPLLELSFTGAILFRNPAKESSSKGKVPKRSLLWANLSWIKESFLKIQVLEKENSNLRKFRHVKIHKDQKILKY